MHLGALIFISLGFAACERESAEILETAEVLETADVSMNKNLSSGPYEFEAPVYDIASTPDGSILVGVNEGESRSVQIIKNGEIKTMVHVDSETNIQGITAIGSGNAFLTTAGSDLARNGELYRVSHGSARMVADLAAFERENDPDAFEGFQWKNQLCEAIDGFSAGPQNNPFKVKAVSGHMALLADAAGNTLLSATTSGEIDWKAVFPPPLDENGDWKVRWETQNESGETIPCYVQPVPTSVAVGPDGYIYVGELTGTLSQADGFFPVGLSRVWKIRAGATNVVCSQTNPSGDCEMLIDGLTSVIDLAIGPDGRLYVVEFDESSWFASFIPGVATGGTISSYDLEGNLMETVASSLSFPSAITFDKKGNLWLLENNNIALPGRKPTVRLLNY